MSTEFYLYGKFDCHPCKVMLRELQQLRKAYAFEIRTIDIRGDKFLLEKYGKSIPVLVANGEEICHFTLDDRKVTSYLNSLQSIPDYI